MKRQISVLLATLFIFICPVKTFAGPLSLRNSLGRFLPSVLGISGSIGTGYAGGEGIGSAKETLLETGADSTGITGCEIWQAGVFSQWTITPPWSAALDFSLSPLSFAVMGFNARGDPVEGVRYSFLNLDIAPLAVYSHDIFKGTAYVMAGPLLGLRLTDGEVFYKSDGFAWTYTIPGEQMQDASLGAVLRTGLSIRLGPGFMDGGLRFTWHYSSVQGFLTPEFIPVNIFTMAVTGGYSFRGKNYDTEN